VLLGTRGTVREFDATYDAVGNPQIITTSREDGATRTSAVVYDPMFNLVPTTITTAATGVPATQVVISYDPVTLNVVSTMDPNGTRHGTTYDGFGRPVLSLITPQGGAPGALSVMSYVGFTFGESPQRRISQKVFTEPVIPADLTTVNAAVGRTSTVYLDELGREMRTELMLGASYSNQKLIVGRRTYDSLGRVVFEADPFPSDQSFATAYGTSQFFNTDGTPSCIIRGNAASTGGWHHACDRREPRDLPDLLPARVRGQPRVRERARRRLAARRLSAGWGKKGQLHDGDRLDFCALDLARAYAPRARGVHP
jgi:hypothetical protein